MAAPPPALAQSLAENRSPDAAYAAVAACLSRTGLADAHRCVGRAAERCRRAPGGDTMVAAASCVAAEASAWDRRLNQVYGRLRKRLDARAGTALRDAQRQWLRFRDQGCAVWREIFRGGSLARLNEIACLRDRTAERVIELERVWDAIDN